MHKIILNILAILLYAAVTVPGAKADSPGASDDYRLKAEFIYNFAKFVKWPQDEEPMTVSESGIEGEPHLHLCILGDDPFGTSIDGIENKTVRGRAVKIRRIRKTEAAMRDCRILFICPSEKKRLAGILRRIGNAPILTVAEMKGFATSGGIINLIQADNQLRFEINSDAADTAGLKISSQLLKLARIVKVP